MSLATDGNKIATMRPITIISTITLAIVISVLAASQSVGAQSSKGSQGTSRPASGSGTGSNSYGAPAPSPVAQFRQQQQQTGGFRPATTSSPAAAATASAGTGSQKRRPQQQQQQQPIQQTQSYATQFNDNSLTNDSPSQPTTEDPLADSEPALYGSVAGQPGVDFPAYTRIPKTSFSCEGKGFDFGFYADEEASCQVYHVCWEGRRESFLCGIGTVFNQAILACDYWHSVDCSKSSQFYGVNSELGKSSAEPASAGSQRIQPARTQQPSPISVGGSSSSSLGSPTLPSPSSSSNVGTNFGEPINQRRVGPSVGQQQQPVVQQQQQQFSADDSSFNQPQQIQVPNYKSPDRQAQAATPASSANFGAVATFAPQRVQQTSYDYQQPQQQQQRPIQANDNPVKTVNQQRTPIAQVQVQAPIVTSTAPPPPPPVKRPRFNMDFNQKVNSLIDSPVRLPIKNGNQKRPQQKQTNFNQQPVNNNRVQQQQQQGGNSKKGGNKRQQQQVNYQQPQQQIQQQIPEPQRQEPQRQEPQQQQQQTYDNELDEPQQQQQQQTFDDSPVQTSTVQTGGSYNTNNNNNNNAGQSIRNNQAPNFQVPQQAIQTIVRSGGNSNDGSSAITTQYDTMSPANQATGAAASQTDQNSYEPNSSDDQYNSSVNDDFRSAGAKAAASQNQNWYIMRSI